ncbi:hypothetical protein JCM8208_000981 [Rhodotorula glutinis]
MSSTDEKSIEGDGKYDGAAVEPSATVVDIDPVVERRVLRKIDMTVLPAFAMCHLCAFSLLLNYLDKIGLSYAAIFGMRTDLNLVGQEYQNLASYFYFGQLASEPVVLWLLHKLPIRTFVAISIVAWSIVVAAQAAPHNYIGMLVVRIMLGFTEGAVAPAFIVLSSVWWRKREQPIRLAVFVSFNALAQIVGALLLYGCGSIDNVALKGWRLSYIICAILTLIGGVFFFIFVPKSPSTAWFLKPEEREVAALRVASERASGEHSEWSWPQFWATLTDVRFYIVFLWATLVCITSIVTMGSIIIKGFQFDPFKTILVGLPGPGIQLICIWTGALALKRFPNSRGWTQMALTLVPLVGVIVMRTLPYSDANRWGLVVGYWMATANSSVYVVNMSLIASNFKGHTRKSMVSVVYFMGYCAGCIAGPQLFLTKEAPLYRTATNAIIALYCIYIASMFLYQEMSRRENRRRDRLAAEGVEAAQPRPATKEDNTTDIDDLAFRYIL